MKAKKTTRHGICAICGVYGTVTHEHVPPRNLFLKPRPSNTITVDLCRSCNHSYHLDDEYFRIYVASGAQLGTKLMELWKQKVVGSSFARGGGLKGLLRNDREAIQQYAQSNPLKLFGGGTLPQELVGMTQAYGADRINAVIEKIVRCLHTKHTGRVLFAPLEVDVAPLEANVWQTTFDNRSGEVGHDNEFVYRYENLTQPTETWWLIFYEHCAFTVRRQFAAQPV